MPFTRLVIAWLFDCNLTNLLKYNVLWSQFLLRPKNNHVYNHISNISSNFRILLNEAGYYLSNYIYNRYSLFHNQNCVNLTPKSKDAFVVIMMTNAIDREASNLSLLKNTPAGVSEDYMA